MPYDDQLTNLLVDLETHLRGIDPGCRERIMSFVKSQEKRRKRIVQCVEDMQSALDTLRVLVKYMQFDLEATKRENEYLRAEINDLHSILESKGYYSEPPAEDGLELPPPDEGGFTDWGFNTESHGFMPPHDDLDQPDVDDDFWNTGTGGD